PIADLECQWCKTFRELSRPLDIGEPSEIECFLINCADVRGGPISVEVGIELIPCITGSRLQFRIDIGTGQSGILEIDVERHPLTDHVKRIALATCNGEALHRDRWMSGGVERRKRIDTAMKEIAICAGTFHRVAGRDNALLHSV